MKGNPKVIYIVCHIYITRETYLCPKSPSELQPSFGSGTQSSVVFQPGSVQPTSPCFIISAYSFISLLLCPKSPSELWLSFGSGTQSSMVFRPGSVQSISPCFIILAYSFISPSLILFPHMFHVPCSRSLFLF